MATHAADIPPMGVAQGIGMSRPAQADGRYLFGPVIDFLCLGGSTLLLLPIVLALGDSDNYPAMASIMLIVAHLINHPHFAASYQIFYRGFAGEGAYSGARAVDAGALYFRRGRRTRRVAPRLSSIDIVAARRPDAGLRRQPDGPCVGWHYVKQGYGMLMVDAVLKRRFIKDRNKKVLLVNSYVAWSFAGWVSTTRSASSMICGALHYYSFAIPQPIVAIATAIAAVTGERGDCGSGPAVALGANGGLPVNGVIAYFVSIYVWLMFVAINPLWLLVVPALHSLQYLVVVWPLRAQL